jgi:predicted nucleic acid-binding protein
MTTSVVCVLDTNVSMALWLFEDPQLHALRGALEARQLVAMAAESHQAELEHVISRRVQAGLTSPDLAQAMLGRWHAWVVVHAPANHPSPSALRPIETVETRAPQCTDASDQSFVDLAVRLRASWLFSRDRAVLKLNRRLWRDHGVHAVRPDRWLNVQPPQAATALQRPTHRRHAERGLKEIEP